MLDQEAVGEFLEECFEILDQMAAACASGQTSSVFREGLDGLERGLHTIKGNSAAFGFDELSAAAGSTLDWLRGARRASGSILERPEDIQLVLRFLSALRRYLQLLNHNEVPRVGYFSSLLAPAASADVGLPGARGHGAQQSSSREAPFAWDEEARRILATAPPIVPRIDNIVWMAIKTLTARAGRPAEGATLAVPPRPEANPAPAPAAPEAGRKLPEARPADPQPERAPGPSRSAGPAPDWVLHGYAIEAVEKAGWLRRLQDRCPVNGTLEALLSEVSDVLGAIASWSTGARAAPLSSFLAEPIRIVTQQSAALGKPLQVDTSACDVPVVPMVGKLLRSLIAELLYVTVLGLEDSREKPAPVVMSATRSDGHYELTVSKLPGLKSARSKPRLDRLGTHANRCGANVVRRKRGDATVLSVPEHLDGMQIVVVRIGGELMGIPLHRIEAVSDVRLETGSSAWGEVWIDVAGQRLPLLDLAPGRGAAEEARAIVVRTDKGRRALKVDDILRRQDVIVLPVAEGSDFDGTFGACVALDGFERLPLLWCAARVFDGQGLQTAR